jgi:hypothetical protein
MLLRSGHTIQYTESSQNTSRKRKRNSNSSIVCYAPPETFHRVELEKKLNEAYFIKPEMRRILIDWLFEVASEYNLNNNTIVLSIFLLDFYLLRCATTLRVPKLQLIGIVALASAAKIYEIHPPTIADYIYISDNIYTEAEYMSSETDLIVLLSNHETGKQLLLNSIICPNTYFQILSRNIQWEMTKLDRNYMALLFNYWYAIGISQLTCAKIDNCTIATAVWLICRRTLKKGKKVIPSITTSPAKKVGLLTYYYPDS